MCCLYFLGIVLALVLTHFKLYSSLTDTQQHNLPTEAPKALLEQNSLLQKTINSLTSDGALLEFMKLAFDKAQH